MLFLSSYDIQLSLLPTTIGADAVDTSYIGVAMTSKRVAHDAGKVLSDRKSTKKEKEIAGSALEQTKKQPKRPPAK